MKHALLGLALIATLATGCKKGSGDACGSGDDCKDGLSCVDWSDAHTEAIGKCEGDKCCASKKKVRKAECKALTAAIEGTDVTGLDWKKPDDLKDLARKLSKRVEAYEAVDVKDNELEVIKDDYIQMAREMAESAEKRALGVNQFDGPVVHGESKRMKKIGTQERGVVDKLNAACKSKVRPVLREGGAGIAK